MTSPAALHSADSDEHFTPVEVTAAAAHAMGAIDLDPFSCEAANAVVGAAMFYGPGDGAAGANGYALDWGSTEDPQRVFENPPSSRVLWKPARAPKALVKPGAIHGWWKLIDEYEAGRVSQAIFLSFNMNLFQTAQRFGYPAPQSFAFCVPSKRLKFWGETRAPGVGSPSHASAIIYLPPPGNARIGAGLRFREAFSPLGAVRL